MKTRKLTIKSLLVTVLALLACDPEYPTPYATNEYNSATGNAGIMFTNASPNSTTLSLAVDNIELETTEVAFGVKFPATTGYSSTIPAGSRNIRLLAPDGTSLGSVRSTINANSTSSYFGIGRADVTLAARADRARLIEFLAESLPAVPTSTPNTAHVRLLNFGLTTAPVAPATSGGTLGSIVLRIDATSPTPAPTIPVVTPASTGTYFLPSDQVFPIPAPVDGTVPDLRSLPKSYASTTSPFTALTVPTVGGAGNSYVVDVVTSSNGNIVLDDVALNLVAGRVYTLALIGSSVGGEGPYQVLVIRHR